MEKDFNGWNLEKITIENRHEEILFHEREIWWCSLGINIGFDQDGKNDLFERPVLIIKKFNRDVLLALPLTRTNKTNKYYYSLAQNEEENSSVILSQIRLISSKRLLRKMRMVPGEEFQQIVKRLKSLL